MLLTAKFFLISIFKPDKYGFISGGFSFELIYFCGINFLILKIYGMFKLLPLMWYHLIPLLYHHLELRYFLTCTGELLSTPKVITFPSQTQFEYEKSERESNSIPHPE